MSRPARASPLDPRKAPRQQRSEHTVALLVEAAAQVLESDGLEGFNTNAVARRAGVSVGSLYQYFPNKDALIVALMQREDVRFYEEGVRALKRSDGRDAMHAFIDAAVRQQLERPTLARLLDVEESRPEIQQVLGGSRSFRLLLEEVLQHEALPAQPRPRVAVLDLGAIIRGLTDGAGERGETDSADLRRRVAAAVFGYLEHMQEPTPAKNASSRSLVVRKRASTR